MKKLGITLSLLLPLSFALLMFEELLIKWRIINLKDLKGVAGGEDGTLLEYLLNAWIWDGAILLLFVVSIPLLFLGLGILLSLERKVRRCPAETA